MKWGEVKLAFLFLFAMFVCKQSKSSWHSYILILIPILIPIPGQGLNAIWLGQFRWYFYMPFMQMQGTAETDSVNNRNGRRKRFSHKVCGSYQLVSSVYLGGDSSGHRPECVSVPINGPPNKPPPHGQTFDEWLAAAQSCLPERDKPFAARLMHFNAPIDYPISCECNKNTRTLSNCIRRQRIVHFIENQSSVWCEKLLA